MTIVTMLLFIASIHPKVNIKFNHEIENHVLFLNPFFFSFFLYSNVIHFPLLIQLSSSTEHLGGGGKAGPLFATEIEGDQR